MVESELVKFAKLEFFHTGTTHCIPNSQPHPIGNPAVVDYLASRATFAVKATDCRSQLPVSPTHTNMSAVDAPPPTALDAPERALRGLVAAAAFLPTRSIFALRATCATVRAAVDGDEGVWRQALMQDWRVPLRELAELRGWHAAVSSRELWRAGLAEFGPGAAAYAAVKSAWDAIEGWAVAHLPALMRNLAPGASRGETARVEAAFASRHDGARFPASFTSLFRVHDGQNRGSRPSINQGILGIFGGLEVYDNVHVVALLPLNEMEIFDARVYGRLPRIRFAGGPAASSALSLDVSTGMVYASTYRDSENPYREMPAAPRLLPGSAEMTAAQARFGGVAPADAQFLTWLYEYVRRLTTGCYSVGNFDPSTINHAAIKPWTPLNSAALAAHAALLQQKKTAREGAGGGAAADSDATAGGRAPPLSPAEVAWCLAGRSSLLPSHMSVDDDPQNMRLRYICAFPENGAHTSHAVTEGVHVQVSCAFLHFDSRPDPRFTLAIDDALGVSPTASLPRLSCDGQWSGEDTGEGRGGSMAVGDDAAAGSSRDGDDEGDDERGGRDAGLGTFHWAYRVRLWLTAGSPTHTVQLENRGWDIEEYVPGQPIHRESVRGAGVIGLNPTLTRCRCDGEAAAGRECRGLLGEGEEVGVGAAWGGRGGSGRGGTQGRLPLLFLLRGSPAGRSPCAPHPSL